MTPKITNKCENVAPRLQKDLQNGGKSGLRTWFFRLWANLDFVRQYNEIHGFSYFRAVPGPSKIDKKTGLEKHVKKEHQKSCFLAKKLQKATPNGAQMGHKFPPNLPPSVTFSDFVTFRGPRVPQRRLKATLGPKLTPKCMKIAPKVVQNTSTFDKIIWKHYRKNVQQYGLKYVP